MSELPERIWVSEPQKLPPDPCRSGYWVDYPCIDTEYVRADVAAAEIDRLRAALEEIADYDTGATAGLAYTAKLALEQTPIKT